MSLLRQGIWGILVKVLSILLSFIIVAFLARLLGPEQYGIYSVVLATVTVLAVPAALGVPNFVVRQVAHAVSDGNSLLRKRIVHAASSLVLLISTIIFVAAALWIVVGQPKATYRAITWVGLFLIPLMSLNQVVGAALRGIGRIIEGLLLGLVFRHLLFLGLLFGWFVLVGELGATLAMKLHLLAALLTLGLGAIRWWTLPRHEPYLSGQAHIPNFTMREMLLSTGVFGIIAGAQTLNANLDVIMLGALLDAESAGLYRLGSTAALLTVAGMQAINMVMMPHFARAHREGDMALLQRHATRSARMILLTAVPVAAILALLGQHIIAMAFGPDYADSFAPMMILVAGQLVSALFGSVVSILNMTGYEVQTMKVVLLACGVNVVLNAVLIPPYGVEGAAIATAFTVIFWNTILYFVVRKRLSIDSTAFGASVRSA